MGNQMWQYAFAIAQKEAHPQEEVLIDTSHFKGYGRHNGYELDRVFTINGIGVADRKQINKVSRYIPHFMFSRIARSILPLKKTEYIDSHWYVYNSKALTLKGDRYFEGYWLSPEYFNFCKDEVKRQFTFKNIDEKNYQLGEEMINCESCSIHIRRGDYVDAPTFKDICTLDYYKRAIYGLKKGGLKYTFYIFSNDLEWCKENLSEVLDGHEVKYVEGNGGVDSYKDMYLMSCCRNMILANSSFSWWAAYLNRNDKPMVYIPTRWVNFTDCMDVAVESWKRI